MTKVSDTLSFSLSRIYAEGWKAARRSSLEAEADLNKLAAANPYKNEPERTRWNEGFAKGAK